MNRYFPRLNILKCYNVAQYTAVRMIIKTFEGEDFVEGKAKSYAHELYLQMLDDETKQETLDRMKEIYETEEPKAG